VRTFHRTRELRTRNQPDALRQGRGVWRRQRAFRDWLRAHLADARRYAELKRTGAHESPDDLDGAEYARAKSVLIEQILTHAMPA
jgi:GrpB-like predicted nucleotidyltransferase (UPF0157 family)